ncbi:transposase family protein [Acinetobacter piscicola]|uniref:Transposase family protein n=1 Tax=Acinetobacter piscicola TaxID=2006115 RepID=A0A7S7AJI8_9GAMM|nr:transposase family protein [Acinetobacter piscicola]QOW48079.1 transposase family protein [Acinetobacter piscicola]
MEVSCYFGTHQSIEHPKKQKKFYSGKKKRHTIKAQLTVNYETKQILSLAVSSGRTHDFQLFKNHQKKQRYKALLLVDKGYQGLVKLGVTCLIPFKASKKQTLCPLQKRINREIGRRICIEHINSKLKVFRILAERYWNRRKRMGLRLNLIAAFYNMELIKKYFLQEVY